ncbi:MAG: DegT/DnrJ/EryC1/StrS family aminotransferase [Planctomycetes bacterium]|nr:DegT/DnrJ/EryC1/StrS family aminotransferase [Planctomycetota bacterium]
MTTQTIDIPSPAAETAPAVPFSDLVRDSAPLQAELGDAVGEIISSCRFIGGQVVDEFAEDFARYCGVRHAIPCSNGTEALRLTLTAVLGEGDGTREIVTVSHTFAATAEAIIAAGFKPVFVDVDPRTYLMDLDAAERACTPHTVAIVPVHLYGQMVDMPGLAAFAGDRGLAVIEDASQSHGARFGDIRPGQVSDAATFSFYPGKNLGAWGDAGAVVTNDSDVESRIAQLADHGRTDKFTHAYVGTNARMDAIHAAVLRVKLQYLDQWNAARRQVASWYDESLDGCDSIVRPAAFSRGVHVYHQYVVQVEKRDEIRRCLGEAGIGTGIHYPVPVHEQPAYTHLISEPGALPETHRLCSRILSLPIYPSMTREQVMHVAQVLRAAIPSQSQL